MVHAGDFKRIKSNAYSLENNRVFVKLTILGNIGGNINARVKGGVVSRKRRKRILKLAKGYYGAKHILFRYNGRRTCQYFPHASRY